MSKLTRYEKEKLRDLVLQCPIRRLSCNEAVTFVAEKLVSYIATRTFGYLYRRQVKANPLCIQNHTIKT
jgi:hypothetical protein